MRAFESAVRKVKRRRSRPDGGNGLAGGPRRNAEALRYGREETHRNEFRRNECGDPGEEPEDDWHDGNASGE